MSAMLELRNESARVVVDTANGGRLASMQLFGREILVTHADNPLHWGSYPMAPWAGRTRRGRFTHAEEQFQLPITLAPHAIHGTVWNRPWTQIDDNTLTIPLGSDWPFAGRAEQRFFLEDNRLRLQLTLYADDQPYPASLGWHPFFLRNVGEGSDATLSFEALSMYDVDDEQISTGTLIDPTAGPWDACFTNIRSQPVIDWRGFLSLSLRSDLDHWVVYDLLAHALCVEPMSGPPNALNLAPRIVSPGAPLVGEFELSWKRH